MDVLLHKHRAKHIANIPDGLPELCSDISREVIRSQPLDIYCFIADYLNTLLITRENAKVAIKIVQSVTLKSEHIVEILVSTGLRLEEIAAVAPRLQKAFKVYLDAVDEQKKECGCDADSDVDDENEISICQILRASGASYPDAQRAAIRIQALFRGHQERMSFAESRGEVQWQRAAARTVELLRKCGVTRAEATRAAIMIQAAYRGYYTRKNFTRKRGRHGKEPKETVDMCAWFRMTLEESGITPQRANHAAIVIQVAYRRYRKRKSGEGVSSVPSTAMRATTMASPRKGDTASEVPSSVRSMKSEIKSELKSESDIGDKSESKIGDTDDEVKDDTKTVASARSDISEVKSEVKPQDETKDAEDQSKTVFEVDENVDEPVKTEEAANEVQPEVPETSQTEAVENADEAAVEHGDQVVKEVEGEEQKEATEE